MYDMFIYLFIIIIILCFFYFFYINYLLPASCSSVGSDPNLLGNQWLSVGDNLATLYKNGLLLLMFI
jgi:hypothetical protein